MTQNTSDRVRRRRHGAAGLILVLVAVAFSRQNIEVFAPDGTIAAPALRGLLITARVVLIVLGGALILGYGPRRAAIIPSPLIVLALSLMVSIAAAEGLVRLAMGPVEWWAPAPVYVGEFSNRPSGAFVTDSLIGWRMHPGRSFVWTIDGRDRAYAANEAGFRSPYSTAEIAEADTLVTLIGDSFAWGTGVGYDDTFGAVLDEKFHNTVVYNQAQPGMGIDQMWMTLRHYSLPLRPDAVLLAFIDHDFDRSLTAYRRVEGMNKPTFVSSGNQLRPQSHDDVPWPPTLWLQRHSAVMGLGRLVEKSVGYGRPWGDWWSVNAAILDAIVREARTAGTSLILVRLPIRGARPFPQLSAHLSGTGAAFLDLAVDAPDSLFFRTDEHINEAGHRVVASALEPVLMELLR